MRGFLLTLLGTLSFTISTGQEIPQPRSRWSFGVSGSIDRAFLTIRNGEANPHLDRIIALREEHESGRIGYSAGIDVSRDLGSRWSIASGLRFSDRGFRSHHSSVVIATDPVDPVLNGTSFRTDERFHYQYLSLPVMLRSNIGKGRIQFTPAIGIQADLLTAQYSMLEYQFSNASAVSEKETDRFSDYTDLGLSACMELGVIMMIRKAWGIRFAPRACYQITPIADTPIVGHLYEIGLALGATYRF